MGVRACCSSRRDAGASTAGASGSSVKAEPRNHIHLAMSSTVLNMLPMQPSAPDPTNGSGRNVAPSSNVRNPPASVSGA